MLNFIQTDSELTLVVKNKEEFINFINNEQTDTDNMYRIFQELDSEKEPYTYCTADLLGQLSEMPLILLNMGYDDILNPEFEKIWGYNEYMIKSELQELLNEGKVTFKKVL